MGWYKIIKQSSHPLAEKLTAEWSSILFNRLLKDFYYTRKKAKEEPDADIDPNYFVAGFVPAKNSFGVSHILAKMEVKDGLSGIEMGGDLTVDKGRKNHKTLLDTDPEKTMYFTIYVPSDFGEKYFPELSYKIKQSIRHEAEHASPSQESRLEDTRSLVTDSETEMGLRRRLGYMLNPIEVEAFVTGLYYGAKKQKKPFLTLLDDYLAYIKNNLYIIYKKQRPYELIENVFIEIRKKWTNYAMKRYPKIKDTNLTINNIEV